MGNVESISKRFAEQAVTDYEIAACRTRRMTC
jgi:hypothetical protein